MPTWIPFALSFIALVASIVSLGGALLAYTRSEQAPDEGLSERIATLEEAVDELVASPERDLSEIGRLMQEFASDLDHFESQLEEGLEKSKRRENRVRAVVRRGLERMEELGEIDPNLVATAREVFGGDEGGSPEEGVPTMHGHVEGDPLDRPSSVPGLTVRDLMIAHGEG